MQEYVLDFPCSFVYPVIISHCCLSVVGALSLCFVHRAQILIPKMLKSIAIACLDFPRRPQKGKPL